MVGGRKQSRTLRNAARRSTGAVIETMESRTMLSSTLVTQPELRLKQAAGFGTVVGFTPAEIRTAYGFEDVTFGGGSVAADGTGQTIAIIDAYNDPNIVSDLGVFDATFNINAPPNFTIVNQTGGTVLPPTDADAAGETSLDVEWAHAIAPNANILLVLANSLEYNDLFTAIGYARSQPQVSVVSMSFGGSEFINQVDPTAPASETDLDPDFLTPTGHEGITFVASAGDTGAAAGVQYPSASPNVLSVGGTSLTLNANGTYEGETEWNDAEGSTNGGISTIETEPSYQRVAQTTGQRTDPDVAYNGDPETGFAVYDTIAQNGAYGWQEVAGTSAGAPQWAALIAIADQGRAVAGLGTLDGVTQTLPDLYSVYAPPSDTTAYANYLNYFHDVGNESYRYAWGGTVGNAFSASPGYDLQTGLGSPHAANVINLLAGNTATVVDDGSTGLSSAGSTSTVASSVVASPVQVAFITNPLSNVFGGDAGTIKLQVSNTQSTTFNGPISIALYASPDGIVSTTSSVLNVVKISNIIIKPAHFKVVLLKFHYSDSLNNGTYHLTASVQVSGTNDAPGVSVPSTAVSVIPAVVNLATTFVQTTPVLITAGKPTSVLIRIQNLGNFTAQGTLDLSLYASSTGVIDSASTLLTDFSKRKIRLGAGKAMTFRLTFKPASSLVGGTFSLFASATSTTSVTDTDTANNVASLATTAT